MKKRIAVVFEGNSEDRKGMFNAVTERAVHLLKRGEFDVDTYLIQTYDPWFVRMVKDEKKQKWTSSFIVHGLPVQTIRETFSLLDWLLQDKLQLPKPVQWLVSRRLAGKFAGYDLIAAHSYRSALLAAEIHRRFGIPYIVTWHGSDIHRYPFENRARFRATKRLMESAGMNIFVSRSLMATSERITDSCPRTILYNGVDTSRFRHFTPEELEDARKRFGISGAVKNVAYIGNFYTLKNVLCLPEVFEGIHREFGNRVAFYFVGGGKLESQLRKGCRERGIDARFLINVGSDEMPAIYNCMNLIVMPSLKEAFGLVAAEAQACGTPFAGSRVGGIAEVAGDDNTVPLGVHFVRDFTALCVKRLDDGHYTPLSSQFDWNVTAEKESEIIWEILKKEHY